MKFAMTHKVIIVTIVAALALAGGGWWLMSSSTTPAAVKHADDAIQENTQLTIGSSLYEVRCAMCHDDGINGAPSVEAISLLDKEKIVSSLNSGVMQPQSVGLSTEDREAIAIYLTRNQSRNAAAPTENRCAGQLILSSPALWSRWGNDLRNTRFQDGVKAGITAQTARTLKLKWAFGFQSAARARAHPTVTPEAIFTADQHGTVYALDIETGCVWWTFTADAEVRSALTLQAENGAEPAKLFFGDFGANVYAIDANTGQLLWKTVVKDHPAGTITGSVTLYDGRLFVPLSSTEVLSSVNDSYECCTFRGGVTALDALTGALLWRNHTTPPPEKTELNAKGAQMWGPSGAPIWSTPTVDEKRGLLYVGTGENYSSPATDLSDAIVAFDPETGVLVWARQTVSHDAWNGACVTGGINCPREDGPDFDFGAPPILHTLPSGKDIILAGQKSGMIYAMDPDNDGAILWERRAGMGGFNGGVHWGMSVMDERLFVGISDGPGHKKPVGPPRPGMHAFDVETGAPLWSKIEPLTCERPSYECFPGLSAAITATPEVIFAGGLNGHLHAYAAADGEKLWQFDTRTEFETVNGVRANGGSIDSDGPVVANGLVIVNSGYDKFREVPGNVLLVFEAEPLP